MDIISSLMNRFGEPLESELRSAVPAIADQEPLSTFYTMLRYHLGWVKPDGEPAKDGGGKRIRPLLCLLTCEAAGGNPKTALPAAACVELVHNFTLVHDDIQDRSDERRHRPTVWRLWGEAQAINVGDAMYALALLELLKLADKGVQPVIINEAVEELNRTLLALSEGQFLDLSFERRADVTVNEYLSMIERKTAALIASAAWLGAYLATQNRAVAERYRFFGRALGIAFQIQDDLLGIWGDPQVTGKPAGDDIIQRKKTLPLVFALQTADEIWRQRLMHIFGAAAHNISAAEVQEIIELLDKAGAKTYAEEQAKTWYQLALRHLEETITESKAYDELHMLTTALLKRSS